MTAIFLVELKKNIDEGPGRSMAKLTNHMGVARSAIRFTGH